MCVYVWVLYRNPNRWTNRDEILHGSEDLKGFVFVVAKCKSDFKVQANSYFAGTKKHAFEKHSSHRPIKLSALCI